ncbi:MAG: hypothetical protein IE909_08240 [Campylobacterales bacterium]|nr:hypothetical protein [Campylobacterales bacterium]
MSAKKVWGVIFIVLGVVGLLYGGYSYMEISNGVNQLNAFANNMKMPAEMHQLMQKNIDASYKEIFIILGVSVFLSIVGTKMLK